MVIDMSTVHHQRFIPAHSPASNAQLVMIADYMWWANNETAILEWMDTNLPRGRDHQMGMVITLDTEQDLMMFMLRWQN